MVECFGIFYTSLYIVRHEGVVGWHLSFLVVVTIQFNVESVRSCECQFIVNLTAHGIIDTTQYLFTHAKTRKASQEERQPKKTAKAKKKDVRNTKLLISIEA